MEEFIKNIEINKYREITGWLKSSHEELKKFYELLELSMNGLIIAEILPQTIDTLDISKDKSAFSELFMKTVGGISIKAKKEIKNGFPFLMKQSIVMLYSQLETSIKHLIIQIFTIEGSLQHLKEINKIKISFSEYHNLNEVEKIEYFYKKFEENISTGMKYGVKRFEALLKPLALSGDIPEKLKNNISELSQVRNVIVHRNGVADKRFVDFFSSMQYNTSMQYNIGDKIILNKEQFYKYNKSIYCYLIIISCRIGKIRGIDMSPMEKELKPLIAKI